MTQPVDSEPVDGLAITAVEIGQRLGLEIPLGDIERDTITRAISDAQADVEAHLGRPVTPQTYTDTGVYPTSEWPGYRLREPRVVEVIRATPALDLDGMPTGYYTVVYTAGLNAANDRTYAPIKRYLVAAVLNDPAVVRLWQAAQADGALRRESNVSVEGQSVTYQYLTPTGVDTGSGPGALSLDTLDRWRLRGRRVYRRPGPAPDVFASRGY